MSLVIKGDPGKDIRVLEQARMLVETFARDLSNYSAETLTELRATLQPILGDDNSQGDRVMDLKAEGIESHPFKIGGKI